METEQLLTEFVAGVCVAAPRAVVSYVHSLDLQIVGQRLRQSRKVERPSVDMRVDAEIGCRAEKECLALLVGRACLKENVADILHVGVLNRAVTHFFAQVNHSVAKLVGIASKQFVGFVYSCAYELFGDGFHLLFFLRKLASAGCRLVVVVARCEACHRKHAGKQHHY